MNQPRAKNNFLTCLAVICAIGVTFGVRELFYGNSGSRSSPPATQAAPEKRRASFSTTTTLSVTPAAVTTTTTATPPASSTDPSSVTSVPSSSVPSSSVAPVPAPSSTSVVLSPQSARRAGAVASSFTTAMLSWSPGDTPATVRVSCAQWATGAVAKRLVISSAHGPDGVGRAPGESDTVRMTAVSDDDVTASGVGESVVATVRVSSPGAPVSHRVVYLEEWVAHYKFGWRVSQVVQG